MTSNEQLRAHNTHRAKKIQLETALYLAMLALLKKVLKLLVYEFQNGTAVSAAAFQTQILSILHTQYTRVGDAITLKYLNLNVRNPKTDSATNALAAIGYSLAIPKQVITRASFLTQTLQRDIDKAVSETQQSKKPQSAAVLAFFFRSIVEPRPRLIAVTETQNAFELKKHHLSTSFSQVEGRTLRKTWVTILDGRERPWHGDAFGQTQRADDLFTVNDELLMYPGDTSHGASPSNICNCRCSGIYY